MFTDDVTTPTRLEVMIDTLRDLTKQRRMVDAEMLYNLLQPDGLPDLNPQRVQSKAVLRAAKELGLVVDDHGRLAMVDVERLGARATRDWVFEAFDEKVLSSTQIEPYFSRFYSYMLLHGSADHDKTGDIWARDFNHDVFNDEPMPNPFNAEKITGMHRWMRWAGLGWYDSTRTFHCNPYGRLRRVLSRVFERSSYLDDDAFIAALGAACPELDGGAIFSEVTATHNGPGHLLSIGLAQALLDLHIDGVIKLHVALDAAGWSLEQAEPTNLDAPRLHAVELLRRD